jgi:serine-type D-Ala-D-Ala carboxypeptidase/endopeptidase (penicillin-binding protein 4)
MVTRYWGRLYLHFLNLHGIVPSGRIRIGKLSPSSGNRLLRFYAPNTLSQAVDSLLAFSNNFIANQILIAAGADAEGPPGSLEKGVHAAQNYAVKVLKLPSLQIKEGSGISRENRLSARNMYQILLAFKPYAPLLRKSKRELYKTGTLNGISTRAGFMRGKNDALYPFVIMLNDSAPKMKRVRNYLFEYCKE